MRTEINYTEKVIEEPEKKKKVKIRLLQAGFFGLILLQMIFWPVPFALITIILVAIGGIVASVGSLLLSVFLLIGMLIIVVIIIPFSVLLTILGIVTVIVPGFLYGLYQLHIWLYGINHIAGIIVPIAVYLFIGLFMYLNGICVVKFEHLFDLLD